MKPNNFTLTLLILISIVMMHACSRKLQFQQSTVVPAAEGSIKIKKDNNNNYAVTVNVINLAPPEKLSPAKKTYVVWLETQEHGQKNIGQINISSKVFSSTLKGTLKAVTAYKPKSFYITAEDDPARTYPGPQIVLQSEKIN